MKVGVLALQGAFREHREALDALGVESVDVRAPEDLGAVDALILPGGESTTMLHLLRSSELLAPVAARVRAGTPALGTCAGLILLATDVVDGRADQESFGALDVSVRRNAYGRQLESFEADLDIERIGSFPGVFIRAPRIERVGPLVSVLASYAGHPVLVRQGGVWGASFHPELSGDLRLHEAFLSEVSA
jgi:5'-phosphate synthase pdxT subunit